MPQTRVEPAEIDSAGDGSTAYTHLSDGALASVRTKQAEDERTRHEGEGNLPDRIRTKMERAFGSDFSDVEVHRNSTTAERLNAIAYTRDEEIYFAPGYHPYTSQGQEYLGHELAHVVQQQRGDVKTTHHELGYKVSLNSRLEREADAAASKAVSGQQVGFVRNSSGPRQHTKSPLQLLRQSIPSRAFILDVNTSADTVLNELIETAHRASQQAETVSWRRIFYPTLESQIRGRQLGAISHTFTDTEGINTDWDVSISFYMDNVISTGRREQRSITTRQGGGTSPSLGSSQTRTQQSELTVGGEGKGGNVTGEVSVGESVAREQSQTAGGELSGSQAQSSREVVSRREAKLYTHIKVKASVSSSGWDVINPFKWGMHAADKALGPLEATREPQIGTIIFDEPQF